MQPACILPAYTRWEARARRKLRTQPRALVWCWDLPHQVRGRWTQTPHQALLGEATVHQTARDGIGCTPAVAADAFVAEIIVVAARAVAVQTVVAVAADIVVVDRVVVGVLVVPLQHLLRGPKPLSARVGALNSGNRDGSQLQYRPLRRCTAVVQL